MLSFFRSLAIDPSLYERLTLRSESVRRGARGTGIGVDPERVREARLEAGLSLAALAGDDVSRTFIHFVERGRSRPSRDVLALIARRTGKPISYFMPRSTKDGEPTSDLAADLARVSARVRQFATTNRLTDVEREAMKLIEVTLRQGAEFTRLVQTTSKRGSARRIKIEPARATSTESRE
jgi:transcriptional regulator with XRE-family HTH domain